MPATNKKAPLPGSSRSAPAKAAASSNPPSKKRKMETFHYAVRAGRKPGIYTSWKECQDQIVGFKGAQFKKFSLYEDAVAFVAGQNPPSSANDEPTRFYGVAVGRKPGVYTDWGKAQEAFVGWGRPKYKRFETLAEAEEFVRKFSGQATNTAPVAATSDASENASEDALEEIDELQPPAKKVKKTTGASPKSADAVVYTDGSSRGNGKIGAAAGVGVYFGPQDPRNISERLEGDPQTNQRAELTAILRTLEVISDDQPVEIRSDSKYSIKCVTEWYEKWEKNKWNTTTGPVKNKDLVQAIRDKINARDKKGVRTKFTWVKGHDNEPGNVAADLLAVAGSRKV